MPQTKQKYGPPAPQQYGPPDPRVPNPNYSFTAPYPQPQRPNTSLFDPMTDPDDPRMMGNTRTDYQMLRGGEGLGTPPRQAPSEAFPFNQAWRDNVVRNTGNAMDNVGMTAKKAVNAIGDFFSGKWQGLVDRGDRNLTEELGAAIPGVASSIYNTGKGMYDQATDPTNMRGPFAEMYMNRGGLQDRPEMQMRGMETPPVEMPGNLEQASMSIGTDTDKFDSWQAMRGNQGKSKGWMNPVTGMGKYDADVISARDKTNPNWRDQVADQSRFDRDYADQMAQPGEISPMEALGAKMTMGAKDAMGGVGDALSTAGGAIASVPRGAAEMAGRGLGGTFKYGGSLVDAFKKGWMGDQAQGSQQTGMEEVDISPIQSLDDPRLVKKPAKIKGGFKGAFAAARKSGKNQFTYKGKKYNTKLKGQASKPASKKKKQTTNKATPYLSR
tara:strand:- start:11729 stop:13048 length:1320 start_codon:yes stop_codon:yes gene_type:complete